MIDIKKINSLNKSEFLSIFGNVFEKSKWISEKAFGLKPFKSLESFISEIIFNLSNPFDRWDDVNPKLNVGNPEPGYKDILNKFLFVAIGVTCSE